METVMDSLLKLGLETCYL